MRARVLTAAVVVPLALGAAAFALTSSSRAVYPDTYPAAWAAAVCATSPIIGTLSDAGTGPVCQDDNWLVGSNVHNPATSYDFRNCTDYVAWREESTGHLMPKGLGNARDWGSHLTPDDAPAVGAIAWEARGDHVAYVEWVSSDMSTITISEYNEQYLRGQPSWGTGAYDTRTLSARSFRYLHLPMATPAPAPSSTPPTTIGAQTTLSPTTQVTSNSFGIGRVFDDNCVVAWPTAPSYTSKGIEMTMSCDSVPEDRFLFTDVFYPDPHFAINPDTGQIHVHGRIEDISTSDYGYKELVVDASSVTIPSANAP
jgi:surface antigen